jgi:hypothetical protein
MVGTVESQRATNERVETEESPLLGTVTKERLMKTADLEGLACGVLIGKVWRSVMTL